jgi:hypothetical protein
MKLVILPTAFVRGHAFGRAGAGRKTFFADRRREKRCAGKVRLRKELDRAKQSS